MAKTTKDTRPKARVPKGFLDSEGAELRAAERMLATIRTVFESYGFEPLDTPAIEFTDALGKFLPDQDRPNAGVFSFQDEDEQWLSLRYDLTAPLARYVAENVNRLPKPFRRYAMGAVWRNEKPGPGRFRQFTQFDADTVGSESIAADAEICMLVADTLEKLGIARGDYVIKVNNRKLLDGVLEKAGLSGDENAPRRLIVLRAIDKFDKFGAEGVKALLGVGRKDESGDFTRGAGLTSQKADLIVNFLVAENHLRGYETNKSAADLVPEDEFINASGWTYSNQNTITGLTQFLEGTGTGDAALRELEAMFKLLRAAGYGSKRIRFDPSVVRGLEYYTGPVFEAELTFEVKNEDGQIVRFGSVGGGGRYDDLVARFTGERVPATGFSIGVSRLQAAVRALGRLDTADAGGPIVVLVLDKGELTRYQRMAQALRTAGLRAEMYLGSAGLKAQMKYADKRGAPCVVIQGSAERAKGEVQIKDLMEGAKLAATISDAKAWREGRPAQVSVPESRLVEAVREVLDRQKSAVGSRQSADGKREPET